MQRLWMGVAVALLLAGCRENRDDAVQGAERNQPGTMGQGTNAPGSPGSAAPPPQGSAPGAGQGSREPGGGSMFAPGEGTGVTHGDGGTITRDAGVYDGGAHRPGM